VGSFQGQVFIPYRVSPRGRSHDITRQFSHFSFSFLSAPKAAHSLAIHSNRINRVFSSEASLHEHPFWTRIQYIILLYPSPYFSTTASIPFSDVTLTSYFSETFPFLTGTRSVHNLIADEWNLVATIHLQENIGGVIRSRGHYCYLPSAYRVLGRRDTRLKRNI
jgi:hypothetical protein